MTHIGDPVPRRDGNQKVTGAARYAADHQIPKLAHAAVVQSTIARGTILKIHDHAALRMPGVLAVITHENALRLQPPGDYSSGGEYSEHHHPLQDNEIYFDGQYVAVVLPRRGRRLAMQRPVSRFIIRSNGRH